MPNGLAEAANNLAVMGRMGDNEVAHMSHGDMVIPQEIYLQNPEFLVKFKKAMEDQGEDYRTHILGSGFENINPETGSPEFFFRSFFRAIRRAARPVTRVVSSILGGIAPEVDKPAPVPPAPTLPEEKPFEPSRPEAMGRPATLGELGGFDPLQERTALATRGAAGGGLGQAEQDYYLNLLQRNLVSDQGQVGDLGQLAPIERQYLGQAGFPGGDALSVLRAIQQG